MKLITTTKDLTVESENLSSLVYLQYVLEREVLLFVNGADVYIVEKINDKGIVKGITVSCKTIAIYWEFIERYYIIEGEDS